MMNMERKDIAIISGLFFTALTLRAVGVPNVCITVDECTVWHKANLVLANSFIPPAQVFEYTNPSMPYLGALVTALFEGDLNILRMVSVIFGSLSVPFLYLFGKTMYGRKTGLLSALFLCFSVYHSLYSRIIMLEALTLFFIIAFLYFFWLSERRESITHACIAGAMLGLAFDAKYISVFLIPSILAYVLWTRRFNFKALLDKRVVLIFVFAFLFFLPLFICLFYTGVGLEPFYFQGVERFEKTSSVNIPTRSLSPINLLVKVIDDFSDILARGSEILPGAIIFRFSALILLPITLLFYLPRLIKAEKEGSFLLISTLIFFTFLFTVCSTHRYYLIYFLPFYFVMLSNLAIKSYGQLKNHIFTSNTIIRALVILLVTLMLLSYLVTGMVSPYYDRGNSAWTQDAISYIKADTFEDGNENPLVIGSLMYTKSLDYCVRMDELNASVQPIFEPASEYEGGKYVVSLDRIEMLKPDYIVVNEKEYTSYFDTQLRKGLCKNYKLALQSQTTRCKYFVFKRIEEIGGEKQPSVIPEGYSGQISEYIFTRTVPGKMKVAATYPISVQILNNGDYSADFEVRVHSERYIIFVEGGHELVTLDRGESRGFKFRIVPLKESKEDIIITVDLYMWCKVGELNKKVKVDTISDCVRLIEK